MEQEQGTRNPFLELNRQRQNQRNGITDNRTTMLVFIMNIVEIIFIVMCYSENHDEPKPSDQLINHPNDHFENAPDYGLFRNITSAADHCMEHFLDEVRRSPKNNYCVSSIDLQNCFSGLYELVNNKIYLWKDKYDVRFC